MTEVIKTKLLFLITDYVGVKHAETDVDDSNDETDDDCDTHETAGGDGEADDDDGVKY